MSYRSPEEFIAFRPSVLPRIEKEEGRPNF